MIQMLGSQEFEALQVVRRSKYNFLPRSVIAFSNCHRVMVMIRCRNSWPQAMTSLMILLSMSLWRCMWCSSMKKMVLTITKNDIFSIEALQNQYASMEIFLKNVSVNMVSYKVGQLSEAPNPHGTLEEKCLVHYPSLTINETSKILSRQL